MDIFQLVLEFNLLRCLNRYEFPRYLRNLNLTLNPNNISLTCVSTLFFSSQGTAIGKCPKNKLLKGYIELELQLREFDRCRKLYEKYLEFSPENCTTWIKFAELETILGDTERARGIFELAIGQPRLDMPEVMIACLFI